MSKVTGWVLRVLGGLIVAGLLAPFTFALPEGWQGPSLLFGLTGVCVAAALLVGRRAR